MHPLEVKVLTCSILIITAKFRINIRQKSQFYTQEMVILIAKLGRFELLMGRSSSCFGVLSRRGIPGTADGGQRIEVLQLYVNKFFDVKNHSLEESPLCVCLR